MHEYSIVQALLEAVEREARSRNAARVCRLHVRIGELSGVEKDLLASAYEICRESTLCAEADLIIHPVEKRWVCPSCDAALGDGDLLTCSRCGAPARLVQGDEIILQRIEMEVPDV
jgi:hydrogenase nickel incorporation protein HypA/HybF